MGNNVKSCETIWAGNWTYICANRIEIKWAVLTIFLFLEWSCSCGDFRRQSSTWWLLGLFFFLPLFFPFSLLFLPPKNDVLKRGRFRFSTAQRKCFCFYFIQNPFIFSMCGIFSEFKHFSHFMFVSFDSFSIEISQLEIELILLQVSK